MDSENIILSGEPIEIAEFDTYKLATFMISVLDEYDLCDRMIPKESGELYHATMRGFPILAKLVTDFNGNPVDFKGHEMSVIKDKKGNAQVRFGTTPIGSVVDTWIEEREVAGYEGLKSCIMISAKIWKDRFPAYVRVLDSLWAENKVKSSWEIKVAQLEQKPLGKKVLKVFSFIGNALLGVNVEGAVPGAGVYEYAEFGDRDADDDVILAQALSVDVCEENISLTEGGNEELKDEKNGIVADETVATKKEDAVVVEIEDASAEDATKETDTEGTETGVENKDEIAALTSWDIRKKLNKACQEAFKGWTYVCFDFPAEGFCLCEYDYRESELDYLKFAYTVSGDEVSVGEPEKVRLAVSVLQINSVIAEKDDALVKASEKIRDIEAQLAELAPYKAQAEAAEVARVEAETAAKRAEITEFAQKSGFITESEITEDGEIKTMISEMNEVGIKNIVATRFVDSLNSTSTEDVVETATVPESKQEPVAILEDEGVANASIVKLFIGK